ncbi:MAG: hypothetical protein WDA16_01505 [Candidatus Thermoplasmatota archaeon]
MRTITIGLVTGFLVLALAPLSLSSAGSGYCVSQGELTEPSDRCCESTGTVPLSAPDGGMFYIDTRTDVMAGVAWIYEESNAQAALQRGGVDLLGSHHATTPGVGGHEISEDKVGVDFPVSLGGVMIPARSDTVVGISTLMPTLGASFSQGYVPLVKTNASSASVSAWSAPGAYAYADGRYDGCYDQLPGLGHDTNII